MKNYIYIISFLLLGLVSCEDFLDPKITEERTYEEILTQPEMIRGLVTSAYSAIPSVYDNEGGQFLDVATDNAITNELTDPLNKMITFSSFWNSTNNPVSTWNSRYENIRNINEFFEIIENHDILFRKSDSIDNVNYTNNIIGEAYFLRAWTQFDLLRRFGGIDVNGDLLGFPIVKEVFDITNYEQLPRDSYEDCVKQIMTDLDSAMVYLPLEWDDTNDPYTNTLNLGRPTDPVCLALKARVNLYGASPAYNGSGISWNTAAESAHAVIETVTEGSWQLPNVYNLNGLNDYFNDPQNDEIIYRKMQGNQQGDNGIEDRNFPPSYYGNGKCNPTQNLVDAFPMADGYPYDDANDANMYENRDPRFYMSILYNGAIFKGEAVETYNGGKDMIGGANATIDNSTRTGYYVRKWLSDEVSMVPGNESKAKHYNALFRKGEMFLIFAEAANEAGGPDVAINGVTARSAMAEVRRRAGITQPDNYLASITTQEGMRALIKNERRIELCFEGHRFFDLRRWKDQLNSNIEKIDIEQITEGVFVMERISMFDLAYDNSKFYCPIPLNELNKTEFITQNQGW
ncbi:RagB/SusD family nutrient uptake outer membrane protein [Labilibacter marinus]|uniref:RagB/SusD family nutrient uptake outer membrane protein n=1 Tax=Labilibacter marinus TaxID=1477105 RepID=UPI00082D0C92|nr:RagB/SusD family nutrient uptake outer membrane protein [Labilibacter marinus]